VIQPALPGLALERCALERDVRYTPAWCVEVLLKHFAPPGRLVLDPCAGNGAILRVLLEHGYGVEAVEVRSEEAEGLEQLGPTVIGDWLEISTAMQERRDIVTNPPYSLGPDIMRACLSVMKDYCAALVRLNHLGSASWCSLWRDHPPAGLIVLGSRRPSFTADGKTDASEYCWVVWLSSVAPDGAITIGWE
jgi:hypothetical protein